jgi:hypothetical protein
MYHDNENDAYVSPGVTYGEWKGITGPGKQLRDMCVTGRTILKPESGKAISAAHNKWCDDHPGVTREERAKAYRETYEKLAQYY